MKKIYFVLLISLLFLNTSFADVKIGDKAPSFSVTDSNGNNVTLAQFKGKIVVLEWLNDGCPFVKKHYGPGNMQKLQDKYTAQDVVWLSVSSSAEGKQGYHKADEFNQILAEWKAKPTALLLDPNGTLGKLYGAQTTPHMFIINKEGNIAYQGAIDDTASTSPDDIANAKNYVAMALDELIANKPVTTAQTDAYGCSVKYAA